MKNSTKYILIAGAVVVGIGGIVAGQGGFRHGGYHEAGFHGQAGFRGGFQGQRLFTAFDTDLDDVLTQAEVDKARSLQFAKFDKDGDGSLGIEEYQALWMAVMRERMVDRFQRHDDDGDAKVTPEEFAKRTSRMVSRLDTDGDGKVTRAELRERRLSRRGHRRGG
ncbi:MAG: hypothetical protein HOO19_09365 [Rhodospirillaceae bacterium]|jgi:Ca2+-binding EF-hand superfamily protein|nr:hypothetical protein [Rhodospirillaceae bacterium]MBT3883260.1 hypothetical protein [Rhodospirillaceae bacterium]MBT4117586.1 hypothetical protein [Rhodospirillaceae bacterium]MBT4672043.1 hypothetical protein [Rhodospirillaceae bacterium]MBT4717822.1 hypothetical protein [Rhodospirillaceae bacterium]